MPPDLPERDNDLWPVTLIFERRRSHIILLQAQETQSDSEKAMSVALQSRPLLPRWTPPPVIMAAELDVNPRRKSF